MGTSKEYMVVSGFRTFWKPHIRILVNKYEFLSNYIGFGHKLTKQRKSEEFGLFLKIKKNQANKKLSDDPRKNPVFSIIKINSISVYFFLFLCIMDISAPFVYHIVKILNDCFLFLMAQIRSWRWGSNGAKIL